MPDEAEKVTRSPKVHILVCDYATVSDDGLATIVRGGIDRITGPSLPVSVLVWLYVDVDASGLSVGEHRCVVTVRTATDGVELFEGKGALQVIGEKVSAARFAVPISCSVQSAGKIIVKVTVDDLVAEREILVEAKVPS